jgi:hypothetical protein
MPPALACDHSGVLAIHAATLPSGKVMFFAGSGNNQVRVASPDYGNVAKGIYTSVTWDPMASAAGGPISSPRHDHRARRQPIRLLLRR